MFLNKLIFYKTQQKKIKNIFFFNVNLKDIPKSVLNLFILTYTP